jgi:hypothetical protein
MFIKNLLFVGKTAIVSKDISEDGKLKFDAEGVAEVSDEAGKQLCLLPGFEEDTKVRLTASEIKKAEKEKEKAEAEAKAEADAEKVKKVK